MLRRLFPCASALLVLFAAPQASFSQAPPRTQALPAIDEEAFVAVGGVDQWVSIRGDDPINPVLLIVGGTSVDGPGTVMSPFVRTFGPWERQFTVVQWDTRGAGKTFAQAGQKVGADLTLDQIVSDGLELTERLRARLGKRKIIVLGVNFGSTVGVEMVERRPDLFAAYVGVGQIVENRAASERYAYERLLRLARAAHDDAALADLKLAGPDVWRQPRDPAKVAAFLRAREHYAPPAPNFAVVRDEVLHAPHWSMADALAIQAGMQASEAQLGQDWGEHFDFTHLGATIAVPVVLIQGAENDTAPTPAAKAWLGRIPAPSKTFDVIAGAGNHAIETHNAAVLDALVHDVRPLARGDAAP